MLRNMANIVPDLYQHLCKCRLIMLSETWNTFGDTGAQCCPELQG